MAEMVNGIRDGEANVRSTLLEIEGVGKRFGGVAALRNINLQVRAGEVLGLVGDNGAGKSTLVKIISGVIRADEGTMSLNGVSPYPASPLAAQKAGIQVVHQELSLCGNLDAVANIFLGREIVTLGGLGPLAVLDQDEMYLKARKSMNELGLVSSEDLHVPVAQLSGGQQQIVAIARAVFVDCRVLILDEPTAALGVAERAHILDMIRKLVQSGEKGVVVVSHNLEELLTIADRIVVLRLGQVVGRFDADQVSVHDVVSAIVGGVAMEY